MAKERRKTFSERVKTFILSCVGANRLTKLADPWHNLDCDIRRLLPQTLPLPKICHQHSFADHRDRRLQSLLDTPKIQDRPHSILRSRQRVIAFSQNPFQNHKSTPSPPLWKLDHHKNSNWRTCLHRAWHCTSRLAGRSFPRQRLSSMACRCRHLDADCRSKRHFGKIQTLGQTQSSGYGTFSQRPCGLARRKICAVDEADSWAA